MNINRAFSEYGKQINDFKTLTSRDTQATTKNDATRNVSNSAAKSIVFSATTQKLSHAVQFNDEEKPDMAHLEALRQKINAGEYHVDLDQLTDKLMTEVKRTGK